MSINHHHDHVKKRKKYPWEYKQSPVVDGMTTVVAFMGPIMTLPQIYGIWANGDTGVSAVTWIAYLIGGLVWLLYGLYHKEKIIIYSNLVWIFLDLAIIIGVLKA